MKVTIGIPFFNNEDTLLLAIRSVFAQTYQDWELILLDDGSKDSSLHIAKSVKDKRVRVISDGNNLKLPTRLNQIASQSNGDFLARMDADDIMHPMRIEKQLNTLLSNPECTCISSFTWTINSKNEPIGIRGVQHPNNHLSIKDIFSNKVMIHPTLFARLNWFLQNKYDESMIRAEDAELWVRTFLKKDLSVCCIQEPLYYYREEGSVALYKLLKSYSTQRKIIHYYGPKSIGYFDTYRRYFLSFFKSILVITIFLLKQQHKLITHRNKKLSIIEKKNACYWLNYVLNTKIPGID